MMLVGFAFIAGVLAVAWLISATRRDVLGHMNDAELALCIDHCKTHGEDATRFEYEVSRRQI